MPRSEFSKKTKLAAWDRCQGICECCSMKIIGTPEYDHVVADGLGGGNDLENCEVLCRKCHRLKTSEHDVPKIAKAVRLKEKAAGIRKSKWRWPKRKFGNSMNWNR